MRLQRRGLLAWAGAAAAAATLSACGGKSSSSSTLSSACTPSPTPTWQDAKSHGSGRLNMLSALYQDQASQDSYANNMLTGFFAGTGYSLAASYTSLDKLPDKVITSLAAGKLADVLMPGQGWVPVLERQNALAEMPADITDGLNLDQRLMTGCYWGDKLFALPYALDLTVIGYRTDVLADAGISAPPRTLDELREMAKQLNAPDHGGFDVFGAGVVHLWAMLVGSYGGSLFTPKGGLAFNDGTGVKALDYIIGLVKDGTADPAKIPTGGAQPLFIQQKTAMSPMSSTLWPALRRSHLDDEGHLGFFPLPPDQASKDPVVLQTGTQLAVSRQSQFKEVAFQFCQYALQSQPLLSAVSMLPAVPPRSDVIAGSQLAGNRVMSAGLANVKYATASLGGCPAWLDLEPVIEGQLMAAIRGQQSSDMTVGNLAKVVSDSLSRGA